MSSLLVLEFSGWVVIRLPTDPDPMDERRGVSGYTFAFGDEPDLDRVLWLQPPPPEIPLRSGSPKLGVTVRTASVTDGTTRTPVPVFVGSAVNLLDRPMLENRNWTLTLPGFEPIHPFRLQITGAGFMIGRSAPINPMQPDQPVYLTPSALIVAHGARGIEFEPGTVGRATGIWDGVAVVNARVAALQTELAELRRGNGSPAKEAILLGRLAELAYAQANPTDRRVIMRFMVERFGFPMTGPLEPAATPVSALGAAISARPWNISFWFGGWDPDLLCTFMEGSLVIPLDPPPPPPPPATNVP